MEILEVFRSYEVGKKRLFELRRMDIRNIDRNEFHQIRRNGDDRKRYSDLLREIRNEFIGQLRKPAAVSPN